MGPSSWRGAMPRRLVPTVLLALACLLVARRCGAGAGALTRDAQTRQNIKLLKTYIDAYAGEHGFVFPAAAVVRKGGGLSAPVWPVNPWTGRRDGARQGTRHLHVHGERQGRCIHAHRPPLVRLVHGHGRHAGLAGRRARCAPRRTCRAPGTPPRQPRRIWPPRDRSATRHQPTRRLRAQQRDAAVADAASARRERDAAVADAATAREARDSALAQLATAALAVS